MTALLRAEGRKVVTTRSSLVMAAAVVAYPALTVADVALAGEEPALGADTLLQILWGGADVVSIAALVLGIVAVAGEYRHGTIVPTLLVAPRRARLVVAKLATQAAVGAALALTAATVGLAAGAAYLSARSEPVAVLSGDVALTMAAAVLVASFYAVIGASLGAVVRNQTAAVAGALVWVLAVEKVLPVVLRNGGLRRWLPGGAADRLLHVADPVAAMGSAWTAVAMLAGVVSVLAAAAIVATKGVDVR